MQSFHPSVKWIWPIFLMIIHSVAPMHSLTSVQLITPTYINRFPDPITFLYMKPIVASALEELRKTYPRSFNITHDFVVDPDLTDCHNHSENVIDTLSRYVLRRTVNPDITAFVTTGCDDAAAINDMAREWNYLTITSVAADISTGNREISPTWITTTVSSMPNYVHLYFTLFYQFNWTSIFMIHDVDSFPLYASISDVLYGALDASPQVTVTQVKVFSKDLHFPSGVFTDSLQRFRKISRVCVFMGNGASLRDLLIEAAKQNMTSEYVYIALEVFRDPIFGSFTWKYSDANDNIAYEAYKSLLLLGMAEEPFEESSVPVNDWPRLSRELYSLTDPYYHKVNPYLIGLYASFMMIGMVLNETISIPGTLKLPNGKSLAERFLNRTFRTTVGSIYIDDTGQRRVDLTVSSLNYSTGEFQVASVQHGEGWRWEPLRQIEWTRGKVPPNEPYCGFLGDNRRCFYGDGSNQNITLIVGLVAAFVIGVGFGGLWFQRWQMNISDTWWQIQGDFSAVSKYRRDTKNSLGKPSLLNNARNGKDYR